MSRSSSRDRGRWYGDYLRSISGASRRFITGTTSTNEGGASATNECADGAGNNRRQPIVTNNNNNTCTTTSAGVTKTGSTMLLQEQARCAGEKKKTMTSSVSVSNNGISNRSKTTTTGGTATNDGDGGKKEGPGSSGSEKVSALRSVYSSNNGRDHYNQSAGPTMIGGNRANGSRTTNGTTTSERSVLAPVFAKIPCSADEAAADSGVDSFRPESLTPSRDSHDSLSPGSQGSGDRSSTRKSSTTEQFDFGLKSISSCNNNNGGFADTAATKGLSADSFYRKKNHHQDAAVKEFFLTLEGKGGKGEKGFGFVLKGGHEKGEPVVVDCITRGSAADKSGMKVGDELLEIDAMDVSRAYLAMINATISQSAKAGSLELKLRRVANNDSIHTLGSNSDDIMTRSSSEKKQKEDDVAAMVEQSFDQKRLQFEKAAATTTTTTQQFPSKAPLRRQCEPGRRPAGAYLTSNGAKSSPTSPPPSQVVVAVNRQEYEPRNVGQLVARYAHPDDHHQPDDPDPDLSVVVGSPTSPTRPNSSNSADYRVTSFNAKMTPGNILNFVPESERVARDSNTKTSIGGMAVGDDDSVMSRRKEILDDREEIDQRWRRERARILGLSNGGCDYARPEPTRNYALDKLAVVEAPPSSSIPKTSSPSSSLSSSDHEILDQHRNYVPPPVPTSIATTTIPGVTSRILDHENRIIGNNVISKDPKTSRTKLDHILRKHQRQATEMDLQYLELAANAAASGVDISKSTTTATTIDQQQQQPLLSDVHQHWLVREAEDMRITADRRCRAEKGNTSSRRHSTTTSPSPQVTTAADPPTNAVIQKGTSINNACPRPPSPKYPLRLSASSNLYSSTSSSNSAISSTSSNNQQRMTTTNASENNLLFPPPMRKQRQNPPPPPPPQSSADEEDVELQQGQQEVMPVSATQQCSHCELELGRGAAMAIESLNLFFHLACFKCYVCGLVLSDGAQGADVRVKAKKLYCQRCYSNDEAGLQFSEV